MAAREKKLIRPTNKAAHRPFSRNQKDETCVASKGVEPQQPSNKKTDLRGMERKGRSMRLECRVRVAHTSLHEQVYRCACVTLNVCETKKEH